MNESHSDEIIAQLEKMNSEAGDYITSCKYKTSYDLYGKMRQRAKHDGHLYFYALGTFFQMDQAQYLLDFSTMRERAIELISLLESEEQARKIQPDVPMPIFDHLVYSMSSCAYENLAEATGQLDGYNSEGLQACIADGIQICRQTGKLPCIGCFREYSCDVYMSADDAEIARHQCNLVLDQSLPPSDRGDRRWLAMKKIAWMSCLEGNLEKAISQISESLKLCEDENVSLKLESQLRAILDYDTYLILSGQPTAFASSPFASQRPPKGECPMLDLQEDLSKALELTMNEDWDQASEILVDWDRSLSQSSANHLWFETRLRLVAVKRMSGDTKMAERLAKQLEKKANEATDWLTLRRLAAIMDPDVPTSPIGVFGKQKQTNGSIEDTSTPADSDEQSEPPKDKERGGPLRDAITTIGEKMMIIKPETAEQQMAEVRTELWSYTSEKIDHPDDASGVLHLMTFVMGDCSDAEKTWNWANELASKFQEDGTVLSLLGQLGNLLRFSDNHEFAETITADRLEPLFRKSLELHNTRPRSFMRAGDHFRSEGNIGEAERCYARAFRLERTEGEIAVRLADLYRETDRGRDALHVLDVCLREGSQHPGVPWEAALAAFAVQRYEAMLTYLDRFESESGEKPWMHYYRAIALLELGKPEESFAAIEAEQKFFDEPLFHTISVRGSALAAIGRADEAKVDFRKTLAMKLGEIDYLTPPGIADALQRCWKAAKVMSDLELENEFMQRLLEAGLAEEDMFEPTRTAKAKEVSLFRCLLEQPLNDNWSDHPACLPGQSHWPVYLAEWGVLASDEEEAESIAIQWQQKCFAEETPTLSQILPSDQTYVDSPGVVWQGGRFSPVDFAEEEL